MEWQTLDVALLPTVPSMLGGEERQLLYWFASSQYTGIGEIVDLGAFLGASAATLAAGLRINGAIRDKRRRIHSYDFFEYISGFYGPLLPNECLNDGDDTLPVFWKHLSDLSDHVTAVKGDITTAKWSAEIEFLFVDFTQNWSHHEAVVRTFYPHLVLGSYLVHQDYNYVLCYWLHVWMEYWADYFESVSLHVREGSAVWRLKKPLPAEAFTAPLQTILNTDQILSLIERSHARYGYRNEPIYDCLLSCQRARFFLHAHGKTAARSEAAKIPNLHPLVTQLKDEIERYDSAMYDGFFRYPG